MWGWLLPLVLSWVSMFWLGRVTGWPALRRKALEGWTRAAAAQAKILDMEAKRDNGTW